MPEALGANRNVWERPNLDDRIKSGAGNCRLRRTVTFESLYAGYSVSDDYEMDA